MTTAPSPFVTYSCPHWCERTDHHADVVDADNPPMHEGPTFGFIETTALGDGQPSACTVEVLSFEGAMSVAELRQLAADAEAAAEWLEAHR